MTPEVFWELIAELGADHDEVDAFRTALSRRSGEDISAFWDLVVSHAAVLNTDTYRGQTPIEVGDDPENPLPLGDDAFLDARMAVVAQSREDYDAVVGSIPPVSVPCGGSRSARRWWARAETPTRRRLATRGRRSVRMC